MYVHTTNVYIYNYANDFVKFFLSMAVFYNGKINDVVNVTLKLF